MLAPERQNEILNMLTQRGGVVKMTEIAKKFGVSNETIRRDLDFLQDQQLIRSRMKLTAQYSIANTMQQAN